MCFKGKTGKLLSLEISKGSLISRMPKMCAYLSLFFSFRDPSGQKNKNDSTY